MPSETIGRESDFGSVFCAYISILQDWDLVFLDIMNMLKTTLPREVAEDSMSRLTQQLASVGEQAVACMIMLDSF
jgi:hypothetical protein